MIACREKFSTLAIEAKALELALSQSPNEGLGEDHHPQFSLSTHPPIVPPKIAQLVLALGLGLFVLHAARSGYDHDEIQHLHAAWLVSQGRTPYRDFMEHHHPTLFYLMAPLTRALEGSPRGLVFVVRLLDLGLLAVLLAALVAFARPLSSEQPAALLPLVLLGCFLFMRNSMEVRPDPWMNALCVVGLWQWTTYLRKDGIRRALLAGLCFGAAITFHAKAFPFAILVGLGTALVLRDRAELARAARGATVLVGAALVPLAAFAFAVWKAGYWSEFVFWNYIFNRYYFLETSLPGPSALGTLATSIGEDPLLWIGGFLGLLLAARSIWRREPKAELVIAGTVVVGMIGALLQSHWPFSHNLLLLQPALAVLAVVAIDGIQSPQWRRGIAVLLLVLVAKTSVLCLVYTEGPGASEVQKSLLARTSASDPISVPPPYHPIFRPDTFFFWHAPQNTVLAYLEICRRRECPPGKLDRDRRAWEEQPPRFVYTPADVPAWSPFEFDKHRSAYRPTDIKGLWELAR
jgi:hypothetical protein